MKHVDDIVVLSAVIVMALAAQSMFGQTHRPRIHPPFRQSGQTGGGPSVVEGSTGCTIGVAAARATKDGRPMVWKTRDQNGWDMAMYLNTTYRYRFLAGIDAGSKANSWVALSEKGFAIVAATAFDLEGSGHGLVGLMSLSAGTCATVAEFQHLLDSTNITGRNIAGNYAVMDSTGAAAMFEISGTGYWKYDATDSVTCPRGYVLRTNFSVHGGGNLGWERYQRSTALFEQFSAGDSITPKSIFRYQMRDLADTNGIPYPLPFHGSDGIAPYGYIRADRTICNESSMCGAVLQSVLPGESANKSTFWMILGCPGSGIAIPYWPVGNPPVLAIDNPTAPLNDVANQIFSRFWGQSAWRPYFNSFQIRKDDGSGLFHDLFQAEDQIFASADTLLPRWRAGECDAATVLSAESTYAAFALSALQTARDNMIYVQGVAVNKVFVHPASNDTVTVTTRVINPHSHPLSVKAYYRIGETTIDSSHFADDGLHQDSLAGDNLWGTVWRPPAGELFYNVLVSVCDTMDGNPIIFPMTALFTTAGPVVVDSMITKRLSGELVRVDLWLRNRGTDSTIRSIEAVLRSTDTTVKSFAIDERSLDHLGPGQRTPSPLTYAFDVDASLRSADIALTVEVSSDSIAYWMPKVIAHVLPLTAVPTSSSLIPTEYRLEQNYPNPFNPSTIINYQLPKQSHVTLMVFDVLGRELATLVNGVEEPGYKTARWDATSLASGVYYYRLQAGTFTETKKLLLLR